MNDKKLYTVWVNYLTDDRIEVWAENEEKAGELAKEMALGSVEVDSIDEADTHPYRIRFTRENGRIQVFTAQFYSKPNKREVLEAAKVFAFGDKVITAELVDINNQPI